MPSDADFREMEIRGEGGAPPPRPQGAMPEQPVHDWVREERPGAEGGSAAPAAGVWVGAGGA